MAFVSRFSGLDFFRGCHIIVNSDLGRKWSQIINVRLSFVINASFCIWPNTFNFLSYFCYSNTKEQKSFSKDNYNQKNPVINGIIISCCYLLKNPSFKSCCNPLNSLDMTEYVDLISLFSFWIGFEIYWLLIVILTG